MGSILVTGVPRSGTTWLARLMASSRRTALAGREPMNPRGRQYALGHSLTGWSRLTELTAKQRAALLSAYQGWNPMVYSRFGRRQWAAPLPTTRVVVKDPYALLSTPTVARATGTVPVLVYRHPGAILASYRRVGWTPRIDELVPIVAAERAAGRGADLPALPRPGSSSAAEEMAAFWSVLHHIALGDAAAAGTVIVSHAELAAGGVPAGRVLAQRLGLTWTDAMTAELSKESGSGAAGDTQLHHFDRAPAAVAEEWRNHLPSEEITLVEQVSGPTLAAVEAARLRLS